MRRKLIFLIIVLVAIAFLMKRCEEPYEPTPIKSEPSSASNWVLDGFVPQAIDYVVPPHPFMATQGQNSMHSDGYSSDAHASYGPIGKNTQKNTRIGSTVPGGQCATLTFDTNGDLVGLCAGITGFRIHRLRARSLELLAEYKLPQRPSSYEALFAADRSKIMEDTSGAYFYLDHKGRIVMADADKIVHRIGSKQDDHGDWEFFTDKSWDLTEHVPDNCLRPSNWSPEGECDLITAVMPDFSGLLWFVTLNGRIGTLNQETGAIAMIKIEGEEIQNGFSVSAEGVYIVSDHAMYGFEAGEDGKPTVRWREQYDRGSSRRKGTINQGSGTTPTLMMDRYVTITDNADERMNLLVYKRNDDIEGQRLVCSVPIFEKGHSVTDNSMIAIGRSIIVENNAGFSNAMDQTDWSNAGGGLVRVDVRDDESGCDVVWNSPERAPSSVPKLSLKSGVAYFYTYEHRADGINDWFLLGLDYRTGETVVKLYTGSGQDYDNNWSPITLAPDGTAYIGTSRGIVALWDEE